MTDNRNNCTFSRTVTDIKHYAGLWVENAKLGMIDSLSSVLSSLFGVLILIVLLGIAAMFFAVGLTWLLGILLGSFLWAIFIMGACFVVMAVVVYSLRKRLIVNQAIQMLSRMISEISSKYPDNESN